MKINRMIQGIVLAALLALNACSVDKVAFGTHTVYGLDVDTQPIPTFTLGLDRSELVVGPRYENGAVPPMVASIKVKGGLFNTGVSQVYATGDAADYVTQTKEISVERPKLQGKRATMIFGTNTNLGIKASFVDQIPKSFNFGYKRQELSIIPLGTHNGEDTYGSVLAAVDTDAQVNTVDGVENGYTAYLATGVAAKRMAAKKSIRETFHTEATKSFSSYSAYGGGPSSDKLSKYMNESDAKKQALLTWMDEKGLKTGSGDITMFLYNKMFVDARDEAVRHFGL